MDHTNSSRQLYKKQLATMIGSAARKARERLGLAQVDIAERLGVSVSFYGRIDRGHDVPSVPTLYSMAFALETSANELLGKADSASSIASSARPRWPTSKGNTADEPRELRRLTRQLRNASPQTLKAIDRLLTQIERMHDKPAAPADKHE